MFVLDDVDGVDVGADLIVMCGVGCMWYGDVDMVLCSEEAKHNTNQKSCIVDRPCKGVSYAPTRFATHTTPHHTARPPQEMASVRMLICGIYTVLTSDGV